jgi:hypothetical protein
MPSRIATFVNPGLFAIVLALSGAPGTSQAFAGDETKADATETAATEDVLHMSDGRVLRGQIISETDKQLVFEYRNPQLNVKTKLTYDKEKILKVERDVPAEVSASSTNKPTTSTSSSKKKSEPEKSFGSARLSSDSSDVPAIYVVPIRGQMGTDVVAEVYKDIKKDIEQNKPDVIVFKMDCKDTEDVLYSTLGKEEAGLADMDDFRSLVNLFRDDLRTTRQVMWVKDSQGISSVVALAWPELYMMPDGRLGGLVSARDQTGFDQWQDADVRGKMTAAFMAWINGFLAEYGRHSPVLADAMVQPKFNLSATWKGRDVLWSLDTSGEYIVDSNDKRTTEFRAKTAEDFCISNGTAESLDDLALLLGFREYRVQDGQAEKILDGYITDWRRLYDQAFEQMNDYRQFMGWASGPDAVKYLGRAKTSLERILAAMERYKAVEIRLRRETGTSKHDLIVMIEQIKEQLRRLKDTAPVAGGGGGRGGGGVGPGR